MNKQNQDGGLDADSEPMESEEWEDLLQDWQEDLKAEEKRLSKEEAKLEGEKERLETKENELESRTADLRERDEELTEERRQLKGERRALEEERRALEKKRAELEELQRDAEQDFQGLRVEALAELREEIQEERETREEELEREMSRERQRRLGRLERSVKELRKKEKESLAEKRREVESALDEKRQTVESELGKKREEVERIEARIEEEWEALDEERAELNDREQRLTERETKVGNQEAMLREDRENLQEKVRVRAAERVDELERRLEDKHERIERLEEERRELRGRVQVHEEWRERFGERHPEDVLNDNVSLEQQVDRLRQELTQRPTHDDGERLETLEKEKEGWEKKRQEMQRELASLRSEQANRTRLDVQIQEQRDLRETHARRADSLKEVVSELEDDIERLKGLREGPGDRDARFGNLEEPLPKLAELASQPRDEDSEMEEREWLKRIEDKCQESEMYFHRRLLRAFHTSMKTAEWSPLAVLTGVSGTGKSKLPELYARFGGIQFLSLPVKPDWNSPESLLGYFNPIDNRFDATELLRALVQSQMYPHRPDYDGGFSDCMMIVLLDEMNLAHVEQYFSDLLSKLEERRGNDKPVSLSLPLGADESPYELELERNVLWTGTMNEDATTKALSDKVLDRSNVMSFPRPSELQRRSDARLAKPSPLIRRSVWNEWVKEESGFDDDAIDRFKDAVEQMNDRLEQVGRAVGHRVWQAIEHYMANYPDVSAADSPEEREEAMQTAFEDQVVQRVMPKLRGIETRGDARTKCLEPIREILGERELGLELEEDFKLACSVGHGTFVWKSAKYLEKRT